MDRLSSGAFKFRRGVNAVFCGLRGLSIIDDELELLVELIGSVEKITFVVVWFFDWSIRNKNYNDKTLHNSILLKARL